MMNRAEYMKELAWLLQDVPDSEREEALQYYEDYFDDAGAGREQDVIRELGSPERLAAIIRDGVRSGYEDAGAEYTEHGYENEWYKGPAYAVTPPEQVKKRRIEDKAGAGSGSGSAEGGREDTGRGADGRKQAGRGPERREGCAPPRRRNPLLWLLIICGAVIWLPVAAGLALAILGAAFGVVCAAGGVALAVILAAAALVVCGVILVGLGIGKLFSFPLAGMMLGGAGLVLFGLGVLAVWLSVWFCARAVPGVVHLMGRLIHRTGRLFRKGGAGA